MNVLDVGCGAGRYDTKPLGEVNVDVKRPHFKPNNFVLADAEHLPFRADCFQKTFCIFVLEHLPNALEGMKEIYRTLQNNGVVVVVVPNAWHTPALIRTFLKGKYYEMSDHLSSYTILTLEYLIHHVFSIRHIRFITVKKEERCKKHLRLYSFLSWFTPSFMRSKHIICFAKKS